LKEILQIGSQKFKHHHLEITVVAVPEHSRDTGLSNQFFIDLDLLAEE
jgi:hypothetical protein